MPRPKASNAWWINTCPRYSVGLCQCGCGERTRIAVKGHTEKAWIKGYPRPYVKGHHTRLAGVEYVVDDNGCWVWQLGKNWDGYGSKFHNGKTRIAHRLYYEQHRGPIPKGLTLDHLCRNRACVNPWHLEAVTLQENIARRGLSRTVM